MTTIIDGKKIAENIEVRLREKVSELKGEGKRCGLAAIIVGEDPASKIYVRNKAVACGKIGIGSYVYELPADSGQDKIIALVETLNENAAVSGILVQLPLPESLDEKEILAHIDSAKDVDGFGVVQIGKLILGEKCLKSCTAAGIIELLKAYNIDICGKRAVVIGRSKTVGMPLAVMLTKENATVTVCHSKTINLPEITVTADILVSAVGKSRFVTADMVKPGAVVIDVGTNRLNGKLCGDVDFDNVRKKCSYISPVPGGVGPMTIAMLMSNTVEAAE